MTFNQRYDAMVEFISCFPTISGAAPSDIKELSDGVILFEALSDISPDHFDPSAMQRDVGNWALKANNLRKLIRNIESFFNDVLHKTTDFDHLSEIVSSIARNEDTEAIASFVEIVTAAAVTCRNRARYVGWIMSMESDNQVQMKSVIESSLALLENIDDNDLADDDDQDDMDDTLMSDEDFEGGAEMSGLFRNAMKDLDSATLGMDTATAYSEYSGNDGSGTAGSGSAMSRDILRERDDLRAALAETKRELVAQKANTLTLVEDHESTQKKLRALATDLQERLEMRQDELADVEGKFMNTKRSLEDTEGKMSDLAEKNATLEDELDISNAKALQLKKAEATLLAYRRKLEGAGVMNQQMNDLENQSAKYLGQIVELEMETKKIPELQKAVDDTTRQLKKIEKEKRSVEEYVAAKAAEIAQLKNDVSASITAKKMAEEELTELRSMQESGQGNVEDDLDIPGLSLTSAQSVSDVKEKVMRLEIENKKLQQKLVDTTAAAANANENGQKIVADEATIQALENEITQLQADRKKKDAALVKLSSDKDKLEAYTKKTLSKFQEKYLVALQECKAKLKEKHDKIEALELRSAAEKSSQKKEEKILASTIYELGLTVMQQQLKDR